MTSHHGVGDLYTPALCRYGHERKEGDRFGRMFPDLPALYLNPDALIEAGKPGGGMRAAGNAAKTKTVPVGHVFFGQFIDHDVTLDVDSSVHSVNDPQEIPNSRTPTLDLDCVYGAGPEAQPYMYETGDDNEFAGVKLLVGKGGQDLPRHNGVALIGDFRNDENRIVSQIQLGMIKVHNAFVDELYNDPEKDLKGRDKHKELFEEARRLTTWHYQWAVVHDFLVDMCGPGVVKDILCNGRSFYKPCSHDPFMPVEFSVAAYRFGHSMAPLTIEVQAGQGKQMLFGENSLGSFRAAKDEEIVEWPLVFEVNGSVPQRAEKCDGKLAEVLLALPFISEDEPEAVRSLATRNLRRGQSFRLPSGQQVAASMDVTTAAENRKVNAAAKKVHPDFDGCTPLWLYSLIEGAVLGRGGDSEEKGEGLGPVGGRIVAEVLIGLIECDKRSWLASDRSWTPSAGRETIGELLEWPNHCD